MIVLLGFAIWTLFLIHNVKGIESLFSLKPFHFESISGVIQASSIAIFSFLGFDAITTLAEESVNPRKDIPRAMLLCTCTGFTFMFVTGYLGVLLVPDWKSFISDPSWVDATLFKLAKITGGQSFAFIYTVGFILAMVITNLVGTAAATRLLYGMGRDNMIPRRIFGVINQRWKTPHGNIIFIVMVELILGSISNQDQLAELINYGAISGFLILNFCVIWSGYQLATKKIEFKSFKLEKNIKIKFLLKFFILPNIALTIMLSIFINMKLVTIIFGSMWGMVGIIYYWMIKDNCNSTQSLKYR